MSGKTWLFLSILSAALGASTMALAAGGTSSSSSSSTSNSNSRPIPTTPTCIAGKVWDPAHQMCVVKSSDLSDDALTDYAFALAKAKRFDEALEVISDVKAQDSAKVLNYRGYITRNLGRTDDGINLYLRSVQVDPKYVQVREYLGEAYVIKGRFDLAQQQLDEIGKLCGTQCEEYEDLAKAITAKAVDD
jgi:tetratricopeptide (TPR) repeat protein